MSHEGKLTLGSLFDGSAGFPLGGMLCGIEPRWGSEIEPFPIRVTTRRIPRMKHLGDISQIDGAAVEPVDIVTFGSPCTDLSIAGKRAGLSGERSGLFHQAVRIVREMREATDGEYPRYIVWENVPGAFSSNGGEDFASVLDAVIGLRYPDVHVPVPERWAPAGLVVEDDFSLAWRLLDAQHWGVPQRRKRIYLVADLAAGSAGKILFEPEGMPWHTPPCFREGQAASGCADGGPCASGRVCLNDQGGRRMDVTEEVVCTLRAGANHPPIVLESHPADGRIGIGRSDAMQTLTTRMGTGGGNVPLLLDAPKTLKIRCGKEGGGKGVLIQDDRSATLSCSNDQTLFAPAVFGICSKGSNAMKSDNPCSGFYRADTTRTLDANCGNPGCNQGGMAVVAVQGSMIGRRDENGPRGSGVGMEVSFTLNTVDRHGVAYGVGSDARPGISLTEDVQTPMTDVAKPVYSASKNSFFTHADRELASSLVATDFKDPPIVNDMMPTDVRYIVRRLTPTECARLQGFPDWWCDGLATDNPTDEQIARWRDVFLTKAKIEGRMARPKTDEQIRKWLKDPYSDSAAYRMWGNGVALPNVVFVLSGIAREASADAGEDNV